MFVFALLAVGVAFQRSPKPKRIDTTKASAWIDVHGASVRANRPAKQDVTVPDFGIPLVGVDRSDHPRAPNQSLKNGSVPTAALLVDHGANRTHDSVPDATPVDDVSSAVGSAADTEAAVAGIDDLVPESSPNATPIRPVAVFTGSSADSEAAVAGIGDLVPSDAPNATPIRPVAVADGSPDTEATTDLPAEVAELANATRGRIRTREAKAGRVAAAGTRMSLHEQDRLDADRVVQVKAHPIVYFYWGLGILFVVLVLVVVVLVVRARGGADDTAEEPQKAMVLLDDDLRQRRYLAGDFREKLPLPRAEAPQRGA